VRQLRSDTDAQVLQLAPRSVQIVHNGCVQRIGVRRRLARGVGCSGDALEQGEQEHTHKRWADVSGGRDGRVHLPWLVAGVGSTVQGFHVSAG
jgi:hypothetical protein